MSATTGSNTVFGKTSYIEDINDYLDQTADRIKNKGPFALLGKLFTGKIKSFSEFKSGLRTSVSSVLQSIKEGAAWATVGLSIANERLGKLAWAMLPRSFRNPLPKIVREHMDSPFEKLLDEVRDQANPMVEGPKDDMRRKVHMRRALRKWRKVKDVAATATCDALCNAVPVSAVVPRPAMVPSMG